MGDEERNGPSESQVAVLGSETDQTKIPAPVPTLHYDAFISYSHAADSTLAPSLRNGLQRFATPWGIFRLTNPTRSLRVFQDQASLSANPALWPTIETALSSAEWFILLASPQAAASPWVGKEIEFWRGSKSTERLLIVQTDGEIAWESVANDFDWTRTTALPSQLAGAYPHEPRWIDARWARTGAQATLRDPRFRDLVAELAAPLRGVPKDELIGEDIRQTRRLNRARNVGVAVLSALVVGLAIVVWVAIAQRNDALESRSRALATLADMESERGSPATAVRIALAAMGSRARRGYLPEAELALFRSLERNRETVRLNGGNNSHEKMVTSAVYSPDGKTILTASTDLSMRKWDAASGKEVGSLLASPTQLDAAPVYALFAQGGRTVISRGLDRKIRLLNADDFSLHAAFQRPDVPIGISRFDVSRDGKTIAAAEGDNSISVWDVATKEIQTVLRGHTATAWTAGFGANSTLLTYSLDGTVRLWNVTHGKELRIFGVQQEGNSAAALSPDGNLVAIGSSSFGEGYIIRLWDAVPGTERWILRGHTNVITSLAFSQDSQALISASFDGTARIWNLANGRNIAILRDTDKLLGATLSPDGTLAVTTGSNEKPVVKVWATGPVTGVAVARGHEDRVHSAFFDGDGRRFVTASNDGTVRVWETSTAKQLFSVSACPGRIYEARFNHSGDQIVAACEDGNITIWKVPEMEKVAVLRGHSQAVTSAAFSPDDKMIGSISFDQTFRSWDIAAQQQRHQDNAPNNMLLTKLSGDGRIAGISDATNEHQFVDIVSGQLLPKLNGHAGFVNAGDLSRDSKKIATASSDNTARLWDARTGQAIFVLRGHKGMVNYVAFSPDGRTLATAGFDNVRLWDVVTGQELAILDGHEIQVETVAFSPDGRLLLTAGDKIARLWDVPPRGQDLADFACARVPWPLTDDERARFGIDQEWCSPELSMALREKLGLVAITAGSPTASSPR